MSFIGDWRQHDFAAVAALIAGADRGGRAAGAGPGAGRGLDLETCRAAFAGGGARSSRRWRRLSHRLTVERFGRTMQLYAPLYLSNVCANVCTYCGFSAAEPDPAQGARPTRKSSPRPRRCAALGFDHVLLVTGESGRVGTRVPRAAPAAAAAVFFQPVDRGAAARRGRIRRPGGARGSAPSSSTRRPTTRRPTARHHLSGPKADMDYRLDTPDRLGRAGHEEDRPGRPLRAERLAGRRLVRRAAPALPRADLLADPHTASPFPGCGRTRARHRGRPPSTSATWSRPPAPSGSSARRPSFRSRPGRAPPSATGRSGWASPP